MGKKTMGSKVWIYLAYFSMHKELSKIQFNLFSWPMIISLSSNIPSSSEVGKIEIELLAQEIIFCCSHFVLHLQKKRSFKKSQELSQSTATPPVTTSVLHLKSDTAFTFPTEGRRVLISYGLPAFSILYCIFYGNS